VKKSGDLADDSSLDGSAALDQGQQFESVSSIQICNDVLKKFSCLLNIAQYSTNLKMP
jgi:hypothetical protein